MTQIKRLFGIGILILYALFQPGNSPTKLQLFHAALDTCSQAGAASMPTKCTLYGKIEFVDAFPDVKVEVVSAFADIKVEKVNAFADGPGKWEIVTAFPDFKVQVVDAFPDYKIEYVQAFPGCD